MAATIINGITPVCFLFYYPSCEDAKSAHARIRTLLPAYVHKIRRAAGEWVLKYIIRCNPQQFVHLHSLFVQFPGYDGWYQREIN